MQDLGILRCVITQFYCMDDVCDGCRSKQAHATYIRADQCQGCARNCTAFTVGAGLGTSAAPSCYVHVNVPSQQTSDVPVLLRCRCNHSRVVCTRPCITPCTITSHTSAVQGSTGHRCTTGCQVHLRWTTVPVQESLRGYEGSSALAC